MEGKSITELKMINRLLRRPSIMPRRRRMDGGSKDDRQQQIVEDEGNSDMTRDTDTAEHGEASSASNNLVNMTGK